MPSPWLGALNSSGTYASFPLARSRGREIRKAFGGDPEFREFSEAVFRWQTDWAACAELHVAADAVIRGEEGHPDARSLLHAIARAGPGAPALFRGFALPFRAWEIVAEYHVGATLDLALVSFTSDLNRALEFAWLAEEKDEGTQVVLYLAEGANAVRIDLLAPDEIHWKEHEWLCGGRFAITASEYVGDAGRIELHATHEGYFDAR
jgi:hypothetical protein